MKNLFLILIFTISILPMFENAVKINAYTSPEQKKVELIYNGSYYFVKEDQNITKIDKCFTDKILINAPLDKFESIRKNILFIIKRLDDGTYALRAHVRAVEKNK